MNNSIITIRTGGSSGSAEAISGCCFLGFTLKKGLVSRRWGSVLILFWVLFDLFTGVVATTTGSLTTCLTTCKYVRFRRKSRVRYVRFRRNGRDFICAL